MSIAQWNNFTDYIVGNQVQNGTSQVYACILANKNQPPPNATYWNPVVPSGSGVSSLSGLTGAITQSCNLGIYTNVGQVNTLTLTLPPAVYINAVQTITQSVGTSFTTVPFNVVVVSSGITLPTPTNFTIATAGVYQIIYTLQCDKGVLGPIQNRFNANLLVNGVGVSNSTASTNINNATELVLSSSSIHTLSAGNVVSIRVKVDTAGGGAVLLADAVASPAQPCAVMNIIKIG
jgi:hypothetical protein